MSRDYALAQLDARDLPGWPADLLRHPPSHPPTDPRDFALAEQITVGVVKNLLLLQHLTAHYAGRRLAKIDPLVQKILAVGLYQLRFLSRVPASAAVDQAVSQARRLGRSQAAGFVNAVLRKATREPAAPLPDRSTDPAEYARVVLSHPPEVFEPLGQLLGEADALRFCEHDNAEPPTIVRLLAGASADQLQAEGVSVTPHESPGMFVVAPAKWAVLAEWSRRGIAQVQDPTAAGVAARCGVTPGQTILDRCCGLGTKTMQLRQALGDDGTLVAVDPSRPRCDGLRRLLAERGVTNVLVRPVGWLRDLSADTPRSFDCALIDVPCSNSGVLARRPEARYAQTPADLASLAQLQLDILRDTAPSIRPGGRVVYSTCSVWPSENEQIVGRFLSEFPQFKLIEQSATWPSLNPDPARYHDGGFWAVMEGGSC